MTVRPVFILRPASSRESSLLTDLAIRSKSVWPYPASYIDQCRKELTVTPDYIESCTVVAGELDSKLIGFYSLLLREEGWWLDHFWIEPAVHKMGYGKQQFGNAVSTARSLGVTSLRILSDPFAEQFYLRMGAERVGQKESEFIPGLYLPILKYSVDQGAASSTETAS